MFVFSSRILVFLASVLQVRCFCGESIRWSHTFDMEDVYGMWYGVGYAQHTPDMTNKPNEVGCVTLFITDVSTEPRDDGLDWSIIKRNYTDQNWRSYKTNPWSDTPMAGSWLDIRLNRRKRDMYTERRIRVIWDEDGQSLEQTYVYTPETPGLWVAEQQRPMEKEMRARGIDLWYPDDPPRHPQVIRVLKATQHSMIINHCSDHGDGGIFSLILRRSPSRMQYWEWYDVKKKLFNFDLPNIHRYGEVANFPEATRYPNYNPGYSTNKYNSYSTQRPGAYGGIYSTQGSTYGSQGYGSSYGSQGYGNSYGRGYSSYEQPFMRDIRDYCVNRSPQNGIWVDSLMGMWYGVEFIQHLAGDSRVDYAQSCIVIHIAEPMERNVTCFREHENDKLDIREILGQWKVFEVYMHLKMEGVIQFPVCPIVTIWETEEFPRTTFGSTKLSQYMEFHGERRSSFVKEPSEDWRN
ncbi:Uncharacterized protein OBRU01_17836 [Operophtera brumata]|uniref:Uncharacterized protein n=1 Tax=Operophtera brumata TaxID=104452 RepID=A0A0L7L0K2_OPEBR|nr:Uncharacterized protein OBRU01_17836 [Operophtera brumata]